MISSDIMQWPNTIDEFPFVRVTFNQEHDERIVETSNGWVTINEAMRDGMKRIGMSVQTYTLTAIARVGSIELCSVSYGLCPLTEQPEYDYLINELKAMLPKAIADIKSKINAL